MLEYDYWLQQYYTWQQGGLLQLHLQGSCRHINASNSPNRERGLWAGLCKSILSVEIWFGFSKKETYWWAWVLLSTWAAEPFRARRALKPRPVDTALLPAVMAHLTDCSQWCVLSASHHLPVHPVCPGLQGPKVLRLSWQEFLRLRLQWHGSFHSQRWWYSVTLLLADPDQLFYALRKI